MNFPSLRIPLSRERKMRAYWARSFTMRTADRELAVLYPNPDRVGCPGLWPGERGPRAPRRGAPDVRPLPRMLALLP